MLMNICEIQKNGTDELICKAEIETDVENKRVHQGGREGGMNWETGADIYTFWVLSHSVVFNSL